MPPKGILCRHEYIIDKREHDETLLYRLPPVFVLFSEVPKVVVGHNHTPRFGSKLHDEAIVITDYPFVPNSPGRREDHNPLHLQLIENVLVSDGVLCARRLPPPLRNKDSDGLVAALLEPLDSQLNTLAGEDSAISMPEGEMEGEEGERRQRRRERGDGGGGGEEGGKGGKGVKESAICKLCERGGIETSNNIVPYWKAKC